MRVFVSGVSVWGPGLAGWAAARPVLEGCQVWQNEEHAPPTPPFLSANERRRTSAVMRLALAVAQEATIGAGLEPESLRCVFGSSNGDGAILHEILEALSDADRDVSPTQFHNSVHNAPAGYWTIGNASRLPAASLAGHDSTWGLSLLKAAAEVQVEQAPTLLCVYDRPIPGPIGVLRPTEGAFAAAFVLTPDPTPASLAALTLCHLARPADPARAAPRTRALGTLAIGNPAAQSLRLLEALAASRNDEIEAVCQDGTIAMELHPCSTATRS